MRSVFSLHAPFLSLCIALSIVPLISRALTEGDYTYTVTDGQATITDFNYAYSGALIITNELGGCPVTAIGDFAFYDCASLTSVTIPDNVTSIGQLAFCDCYQMTSVTIPDSVTSIGQLAFCYCYQITSVTIPDSVTSIGIRAFEACTSLTAISVTSNNLFYSSNAGILFNKAQTALIQCPGGIIGSFTIPDGVTSIGDFAFSYCTGLTSITIPGSVTSIGILAFLACSSLNNFAVSTNNPNYTSEHGVLFNLRKTTIVQYPMGKTGSKYTIPSGVTSIGFGAFCYCYQITSVTIPDSVNRIEQYAFAGTGLTGVTLPGSLTSIGYLAFADCTSLTSVFFKGGAPSVVVNALEHTPATIYYLPAFASSWPSNFGGRPTLCWNPTVQNDAAFGFASDRFGFNIAGTPDIPVKVEATTNLATRIWTPVTTANLNASGSLSFTDPASSSLPSRFYRIVFP